MGTMLEPASFEGEVHETSVRARLERLARDDPEPAEGESRAAKSCLQMLEKKISLRRRPSRSVAERAKNVHGYLFPPSQKTAKDRATRLSHDDRKPNGMPGAPGLMNTGVIE